MSEETEINKMVKISSGVPERIVNHSQIEFIVETQSLTEGLGHYDIDIVRLTILPKGKEEDRKVSLSIWHRPYNESGFHSVIPYDTVVMTKEEAIAMFERIIDDIKNMKGE